MQTLTHEPMEKNEKAMTARAASNGMPLMSTVFDHWSAVRQKHTNHRNVQDPDPENKTLFHTSTSKIQMKPLRGKI